MESWIKRFLKLSEGTEIPDMFALWCGLMGVSISLGRRVWIDMGIYKVFPNMFVVLVAGSGRCRKSTVIGIVEDMVLRMSPKPNILSQKITPEALIEALQKGDGVVKAPCTGAVVVDELALFLNRRTYEQGLGSLLISLYDCKDVIEYRTKSRGVERLNEVSLCLLGGSTIEWIREAIPEDAVGGGLTSRIVFVYEKRPKAPQAWTEPRPEDERLKNELVRDLGKLALVTGQVTLSDEARRAFEDEYNRFYETSPLYEDRYLSGYASRRHVHALKLGMLFALSELPDRLIIEARHLDGAFELLKTCEESMKEVLSLIVSTDVGSYVDRVYQMVHHRGSVRRTDLLRAFSHQLSARELDGVIQTLIQSGRIEAVFMGKGVVYRSVDNG